MVEPGPVSYPKLQLYISCRKLKDMDVLSKSDPKVQVLERYGNDTEWQSIGLTECIWDNLNPDFITSFTLDFHFEEQKYLQFKVFDINDKRERIDIADFIGQAECTLNEIVGSPGQQLARTLRIPRSKESRGIILLRTEEEQENKNKLRLHLAGVNLEDISGWFRKFKPFVYINRKLETGALQRVYKSEASIGKNVQWAPFEISMQSLCNSDFDRPLTIEVWDYHSNGSHKFVASSDFSVNKITEEGVRSLQLVNAEKKKKKKSYSSSGSIQIKDMQIIRENSFIDFISGGCQINLIVAVDFTASNVNPMSPNSLHFLNPNGYNQYQAALHSVGEILLSYDSDKKVPMYGYGAKIYGQVSHCFPMSMNPNDPEVYGLQGMMTAYANTLRSVELSGPTLFAQVIQAAVVQAESANVNQHTQQYFVLLILTDGEIHDMQETVDWIVRGSYSPLSIVIIGIGRDNFTNMVTLDADDEPLVDRRGTKMMRDIVQFVPFRSVGNSPVRLAKEVLDEIPREIVNFFKIRNISPNPPIPARAFSRSDSLPPEAVQEQMPYVSQSSFPYAPPPEGVPVGYPISQAVSAPSMPRRH
jgi:hypothetical protein